MANLIPFHFGSQEVRVQVDETGEPWWVLNECCAILDLSEPHRAASRIDADDRKKSTVIDALGRDQEVWLINESGLYTLLLRSTKTAAKRFRRWITQEVLPTLRKTGKYELAPILDRYPELRAITDLALSTAQAREIAEAAQAEAQQANANAVRALETQLFFTVAEYVYINKLESQLPESGYRACSDHLRLYCMDRNIPIRKQPVGGQRWEDEYAYHLSVYAEVLPGWLKRRYAQSTLSELRPIKREIP